MSMVILQVIPLASVTVGHRASQNRQKYFMVISLGSLDETGERFFSKPSVI